MSQNYAAVLINEKGSKWGELLTGLALSIIFVSSDDWGQNSWDVIALKIFDEPTMKNIWLILRILIQINFWMIKSGHFFWVWSNLVIMLCLGQT